VQLNGGFSVMTDTRHRGIDARVNQCMYATMGYSARVKPQVVVMESVRSAFSQGRQLMIALRGVLEQFSGLKYEAYHVMQNAIDLGGAALRPRYFLVLSRVPFGVEWPNLRKAVLSDVIGDLVDMPITWEAQPYTRPGSWWTWREKMRSQSGVVDGHMHLSSPYTARMLDLYEMVNGDWPEGGRINEVAKRCYETYGRLPDSWSHMTDKLLNPHPKNPQFHMGYTAMTRWVMSRPARVITGGALGLVMHPTQPRTITHRETARIMGFPDDWKILPLRGMTGLAQTWGKGISTQCGKWIGTWVSKAIDGQPGSDTGISIGDREWLIGMKVKPEMIIPVNAPVALPQHTESDEYKVAM
jgi:site-specific DNA-cytosine methylase